ncbi:MAG TPA: bifunctional DNA-formamidopyrimidine glycosylase/DNA-(apurinic or apyrimidinic site) lyase [Alphaproteobacteria bacterium]|nr:bifunctional DNA-formamidopyrimidine glycosylase/DNA-(apurinic or apyrimidinic site) lyase [Alphaproteobacteria bacterium]
MPELPEVETVCRGLAAVMTGQRLAQVANHRANLRIALPDNFAARLTGRRVVAMDRRAKYILTKLDDGLIWLIHLGMSGRMSILPKGHNNPPRLAHDHVVFAMENGVEVRFNDARRFGLMTFIEGDPNQHPLLKDIGPEPLGADFSGPILAAALKGKKTPIKAALLDQRVVAGIGNIYACEALYRSGISPKRSSHLVQGERAEKLALAVKDVLNEAIAVGGSTLRDHKQPSGELGYFQHHFAAYDREGGECRICAAQSVKGKAPKQPVIKRIVQSGRSTFYCAVHQR